MHRPVRIVTSVALASWFCAATIASAPAHPLAQRVISRGALAAPVASLQVRSAQRAPHSVFGKIVRLAPNTFVLQTRGGRQLQVDAVAAIASGRFSTPLFVGKLVAVDGSYDARNVLHAVSVTRMSEIVDRSTRPDR